MDSTKDVYEEEMDYYEYLGDYKEYALYQELDNGYFLAFDADEELVCREAILSLVKGFIDDNRKIFEKRSKL